ncbi:MAG: hypothetical protein IBX50_16645 [Marinospirillum sp.]|uniref:hypothetical protein n=1 Tax=Marinospirillum sp. TaxID=2183934 RepID=UPI0019EC8F19|nr:hypothetical protein [Marinospirillum sp.]MBE0508318.1 hypothetical protein [Marinospirillum sp.]
MLLRIKALLAAGLLVPLLGLATVAEARTSHGIGFDAVRYLDQAQDGDQLNLSWQVSTGRRSALVVGIADGDQYQMYEAGFKRYNEKYLSGSFYQLGVSYWNGSSGVSSELGMDIRVGYEIPLSRWAVITGSVGTVYGVDTPENSSSSLPLVFRPHLGVIFHF